MEYNVLDRSVAVSQSIRLSLSRKGNINFSQDESINGYF